MHQDIEGKANALSSTDIAHDFDIITELGANFIRTAHYPHPREFYDYCDRLGIVVQTEVPMVNVLKSTQPADYYTHLEGQYIDMVTQHYNHPSIIFWGLGNEFNAQMDDSSFACIKL
jgi:beta-galactosidase